MKKILILLIFISAGLLFYNEASSSSIVIPGIKATDKPLAKDLSWILSAKTSDIEKILGKNLTLKEKIVLKIYKRRLRKEFHNPGLTNDQTDKGRVALILGIVGLGALLIPYAALVSLSCAIAAIIIGYNVRRQDPLNKRARAAITLGWITIGVFILALIIVIAVLTSITWY